MKKKQPDKYSKSEAIDLFKSIDKHYKTRIDILNTLLELYFEVVDDYGELFSRLSYINGFVPPIDEFDSTQRDLGADAFDFLNETKYLLKRGRFDLAFVIARRTFESLTLMIAFHFDKKLASKWENGKSIQNWEVRKILDAHKEIGGESKESLKELYDYFSENSHPNRNAIPKRMIGKGNYFTLGSFPEPQLLPIVDIGIKIINLWFWLIAYTWYYNAENVKKYDAEFKDDYLEKKEKVIEVKAWLIEQKNNLIDELKTENE